MITLSPLVVYVCLSYWALSFLRDRLICVSLLHIQEKSQVWQTTSTQWMASELTGKGMTERRSMALCLPLYLEPSSCFSAEGKEHYQYGSYLLGLSLNNNNTKWENRVSWILIFTSLCCFSPSSPVFYMGYCTICLLLCNPSLQNLWSKQMSLEIQLRGSTGAGGSTFKTAHSIAGCVLKTHPALSPVVFTFFPRGCLGFLTARWPSSKS